MADLSSINFDATQVEPASFKPVPQGWYNAIIVTSEWKQSKTSGCQFLELKFQIYEGEHKGRTVYARLNLQHSKLEVREIARGELSAICHAINILQPKDTVELHNLPMAIFVKCKKNDYDGTIQNEIKGYKQKLSATEQQSQPTTNNEVPPWMQQK